jgi:hypothetical protein
LPKTLSSERACQSKGSDAAAISPLTIFPVAAGTASLILFDLDIKISDNASAAKLATGAEIIPKDAKAVPKEFHFLVTLKCWFTV